jgi:multidrug efflux system membrane fusion protein
VNQDGNYVWVVKPDKTAEMRKVTVARQIGEETVLNDGVSAGEQVVTDGQLRLEQGTKVDPTPAATITPTADKATPSVTVEP